MSASRSEGFVVRKDKCAPRDEVTELNATTSLLEGCTPLNNSAVESLADGTGLVVWTRVVLRVKQSAIRTAKQAALAGKIPWNQITMHGKEEISKQTSQLQNLWRNIGNLQKLWGQVDSLNKEAIEAKINILKSLHALGDKTKELKNHIISEGSFSQRLRARLIYWST